MVAQGYWEQSRWIDKPPTYKFDSGTTIEFISFDKFGKAHGPRRDVLFINEANNLPYGIADQLITRTREIIWMDWNPSSEFWFYTEMLNRREDIDFITLTYLDNEAIDPNTKAEIEAHRNNKGWWQVYGEGQLGEVEGKIYKDWKIVDDIHHHARLERYGLDYGYSNDPTAIVAIYYYDGGYVLDEICFQKGLSNKQIADILNNNKLAPVVPDSAEPKSNDELKLYGLTIIPAEKGKDSVTNGIQLIQDQRISVTKRSINLIKEYRNYLWETDKDGKILNIPEHTFSHSMDAIRYGMSSILKKPAITKFQASPPAPLYYGDNDLAF